MPFPDIDRCNDQTFKTISGAENHMADSGCLLCGPKVILCADRNWKERSVLRRISKGNNGFIAVDIFTNHVAVLVF